MKKPTRTWAFWSGMLIAGPGFWLLALGYWYGIPFILLGCILIGYFVAEGT